MSEKRFKTPTVGVVYDGNKVVDFHVNGETFNSVRYKTTPGGGIGELQLGGRRVAVAALDTPVVLIGGDHPYPQLWGRNGRDGLAALYASRGIVPYVACNTNSQTGEGIGQGSMLSWDQIKQLENWGMIELGSHGVRHYQDWMSPDAGLHVKYTGAAATATMHVTTTGVVGTTAGNVHDFSLTFASYPTIGELSAAIDALPNWTSSYSTELSGSEASALLLTVADTNAKTCVVASTYGQKFSAAGGLRIFWDSAVTPARNAFALLTSTSLNIIRDGMRVASISLSAHTMTSLLAAVRAVNPALAATDQNGGYYTALCNDAGLSGAYMTGEEDATNLGRGVKYAYHFDCLRAPCVIPAGGLSAAYLRRRNAVGAREAAIANGTDFPVFIQSGENFFAHYAAEMSGEYEHFRGNSQWGIVGLSQMPITLAANGFHTHISTKNHYNSVEAVDGLMDAIEASKGHVVDLLIHAITPDAVPDDGTVAGSSGYYLRTAGVGADMTEAAFVRLLDRLQSARDAGKIRIVTQRDLNQVARVSLPTKNMLFNPTLRARPGADLRITDNWGRLVSGWKLDGFSLPAISQIDGGLEFASAGSLRTVLTQRVVVERGKRYRIGARVEAIGAAADIYGCRFYVASVRGDWPDEMPGQSVERLSSGAMTSPYNDLVLTFVAPTQRGRGFAKIVSLNAQPWNLSTNKNVKLTVPGFSAFDIDCSAGAVSASAVTAKEVSAAINAGIAANAAFSAAPELHMLARAENGRVVLECPRAVESGFDSTGEMKVGAGTTASATSTIFGANDGFAWPDLAGAHDMTWYPVDVQFAFNGVAGVKYRVRDLWMQAVPEGI